MIKTKLNFTRRSCWLVLIVLLIQTRVPAAEPAFKLSDTARIHQTVQNGFTHPGIGLNRVMLEDLRVQVMNKRDPWYSGFVRFASHPRSSRKISIANQSKDDPTRPAMNAFESADVEGRLKTDSDIAMRQALMYWFTGEEAYRANAMRIVRLWSKMDPAKFKAYREVYIHCSFAFKDLIMAAELLRAMDSPNREWAWTDDDTTTFSNNFVIPGVTGFFNHNGWFMNQNGFAYAPAIAGAIFRSDPGDFAKRVERFTVNKDGPDKGSSFSIQDLARMVETNALTGEKVPEPQVQITEMGRDQAHAGDDMTIFTTIARILNSQGTKVDPVTGVPSKAGDAVGVYEFLDHRILAAAEHFSRFMLGHDTPWIPTPSHVGPDGSIRQIYPRIADNYRGRIRQHRMWDLYYHYACKMGVDLSKKAPFYDETFRKRIVSDDYDWLYIPKEATGEALRIPPTEQEPAVVEVELRSANLTAKSFVKEEGERAFVRVCGSPAGARISILSCATGQKTVGLRIRTTGVAEVEMSGFSKPWLLPDTRGEWCHVFYTMSELESFGDIVFFNIKALPETFVDLDQLLRAPEQQPPGFPPADQFLDLVAYPGAPVKLDFPLVGPGRGERVAYRSLDKPEGAVVNPMTGAFSWKPARSGMEVFVVEAAVGSSVFPVKVSIKVAGNRREALEAVRAGYDSDVTHVDASNRLCRKLEARVAEAVESTSDEEFFPLLEELKRAYDTAETLTPLLADGSMDFPRVTSSNIGKVAMNLLVDGNDDTFAGFYLAPDGRYDLDFGPDFKFSATAFAMEGRVNFEDRIDQVRFFGSNDRENWEDLTSEPIRRSTELTKVEAVKAKGRNYRFLRVWKAGGGLEAAEMRVFGLRHETGNKLQSVSLGAARENQTRVPLGDAVKVVIQAREPIRNVRVSIQGAGAEVREADVLTYVAEAFMRPGEAKLGPVRFSIDYQREDGTPADTTYVTTDGSKLVLSDETQLIRNLPDRLELIDPNTGNIAANSRRMLDSLCDDNASTFTELNFKGTGAGAHLVFDFGKASQVRLSAVEMLARPKFRDRIGGAVVEGSNDAETWIPLTDGALPLDDWQTLKMKASRDSFRYLRVFNRNNWHCNLSEIRLHGEVK